MKPKKPALSISRGAAPAGETVRMSYAEVLRRNGALLALAQPWRKLPTITSELKVAARMRDLRDAVEEYNKIREKYVATYNDDVMALAGESAAQVKDRQAKAIEVGKKMSELDEKLVAVPVPVARIVQADLPVALKGVIKLPDGSIVDGEQNARGIAGIVADLGDLYDETSEAKA